MRSGFERGLPGWARAGCSRTSAERRMLYLLDLFALIHSLFGIAVGLK